jgi:hypothetical protein
LQDNEPETDPEREASVTGMLNLWNSLARQFVTDEKLIQNLGLCDLDTNIFKRLYEQVSMLQTFFVVTDGSVIQAIVSPRRSS